MELLENRIREDAEVLPGNILKVSNFLNHQIDVKLMDQMGEEFARLYKDTPVTKILTIESSGIAVAYSVAQKFGVPLVFAKKHKSSNVNEDVYSAKVWSFTHNQEYTVVVSKKYISSCDKILLVDDFLANQNSWRCRRKSPGNLYCYRKRFPERRKRTPRKGFPCGKPCNRR